MTFVQWLFHWLCGSHYVILFDVDGDRLVTGCIFHNSVATAWTDIEGCGKLLLEDDGTVTGCRSIVRWYPLTFKVPDTFARLLEHEDPAAQKKARLAEAEAAAGALRRAFYAIENLRYFVAKVGSESDSHNDWVLTLLADTRENVDELKKLTDPYV